MKHLAMHHELGDVIELWSITRDSPFDDIESAILDIFHSIKKRLILLYIIKVLLLALKEVPYITQVQLFHFSYELLMIAWDVSIIIVDKTVLTDNGRSACNWNG